MPAYQPNVKELSEIGERIIAQHRLGLKILKINYLFRPEAPVSDGHVIAGMTVRVDDRNWSIHKADFLIEISKDVWDEATDQFKEALMDHELGHCGVHYDEDGSPKMDEKSNRIRVYIKRHDIEEHEDVLVRHGAYHKGLRQFLNAFATRKEESKRKKTANEENSDE